MRRFYLVISSVMLGVTAAHADLTQGAQTFALYGGFGGSSDQYDYEPGSKELVTGAGGSFGAQYLYYVKTFPAIALGADITSSSNNDSSNTDRLANYHSTARLNSVVGLAIAKLIFPKGAYRPYLFAGLGAHRSRQQLRGTPVSGGATQTFIDERETNFALGYGIGMDIFPTERWFFGGELRGAWLAGLDTDDNAALRNAGFTADSSQDLNQGNIFLRAGVRF